MGRGRKTVVVQPDEMRTFAAEAERQAAATSDRTLAEGFRQLAQQWRDMAAQAEKQRQG